ncbi:MAG: PD-(D/E)XK nuclease family protein, partial [Patescibacteria group bacterium]
MSDYYNPKKSRGLFDPKSTESFVLSRTGVDLFVQCPRCFYLEKRLGTGRPPGFPFSLNSAVDKLLKKEFDGHRAKGSAHPLMKAYGIDAVPFAHEMLDEWRDALRRGVKRLHEPTGMIIRGGIDDVWVNPKGELHIVDYKATSKSSEVNLDAEWQDGYKRQMEIYQWLFRKNN